LEQSAQQDGGVTVPGGVEEMWIYGTEGHGLVGMVGVGWLVGLVILLVSSNFNAFVIL